MRLGRLHGTGGLLTVFTALLLGTLVLSQDISMALTPGGTEILNLGVIEFSIGSNNYTGNTNETIVTVNNVPQIDIYPSYSSYLQAGKSISITHTIANYGNVDDTIDLEAVSSLGLIVELLASDGETPLTDTDSDGKVDTGLLSSGGSIDIVIKLTAPASLEPGQVDETTVTAISSADPSVIKSVIDTTTILKVKFWDPLVKSVDPSGQVTQGSIITYTNTFGNDGNIPATNVIITDTLDSNLIYIEGSATEPQEITGTVISYDPVARTITWTIPSIPPGYVGQISFKARIDPNTPSDTDIENTISVLSDQTPGVQTSNTVTITVVEQPLRIIKSANKKIAEIGDHVTYTIEVKNVSETMTASQVTVLDSMPHGFRYLKRSTTLDGNDYSEPEIGTNPKWILGSLAPGTSKTLTYRAIISIDAPLGNGVNSATVTGKSPGGNNLFAGPANATIKVKEGVLNSKSIILGRVFIDENQNKMPDEDEPGIRGIRLYLEDGTYAITDEQGKFSIYGVSDGEHVLKLDKMTIPDGYVPVPLDSSFAGNGGLRFITVPYGGPARGDFALVRISREEAVSLKKGKEPVKKKKRYVFRTQSDPISLPLEKQIQSMPAIPEILKPSNGDKLEKGWSDIIIRVPEGTEYSLKVNDVPVSSKYIGKTIHETKRKIFIYQYVSVKLKPGANKIVLDIKASNGNQTTKEIEVIVPGHPKKIVITPDKADIPADGKTVVPFTIRLLDKWGNPALDEHVITVITEKGVILNDDLDSSMPGHQLKVRGGKTRFKLRSTLKTGSDEIKVLLGNVLEEKADIYFTSELRDWIVVGIGELTVGNRDISGHVEKITESDEFDEGIYHDGRLAFFIKGKMLGKYLLTATYDSDKEKKDELFQQVDPDRYYPIYGDASEIGYEAESQEKLYVKIESGRSSLMFGDYHTDLSKNEFSRYNRTFNGLKADINTERFTLKGFGAYTNQTITKDEIQGNGTSGYYFLSKKPVIENSEKIQIEVRDRYHPEKVISSTGKTRYIDYTINYITGTIMFKEPVPSVDEELNPVYIIVVYESEDPGDKYYMYGGRGSIRSGNGSEIGVTAIVEENDLKNSTLYGVDAIVKIGENTELKGEVAKSDTFEMGEGNAWKLGLSSEVNERLKVNLHYRNISQDFQNPSMTGSEVGTEKYEVEVGYNVTEKTYIIAESFVHSDRINQKRLNSTSLGIRQKFSRFNIETGYKYLKSKEDDSSNPDKTSQIVYGGISGNITDKLGASIRREQVITSTEVEDYPTKTAIRLDYKLTENTKAYLTQEFQEGKENRRDTTLLGIESKITDNTILSSRYQIEDAASGERVQASIGLNNKWEIFEGLTLNTTAERIQEIRGEGSGDNTALALAAEYLLREDFKLTGRYELRLGENETANLYNFGTAFKLNKTLSLLAKTSLWTNKKEEGTDALFDGLMGIAYRPLGRESIYLLNTLRYRLDHQGSSVTNDKERSLISSTELSYRVNPRWTVIGKYAGKYSWEELNSKSFESYTDMILAGLNYDITGRWDIGIFTKLMNQYQTDMHSIGAIIKTGYRIKKNFYAEVGYNTSEMNDRDLSGGDYKTHGIFFGMKFKFDEDIFQRGKDN